MLTASRQKCDDRLFSSTQYSGYKKIDVGDSLRGPLESKVRTSKGRLSIKMVKSKRYMIHIDSIYVTFGISPQSFESKLSRK